MSIIIPGRSPMVRGWLLLGFLLAGLSAIAQTFIPPVDPESIESRVTRRLPRNPQLTEAYREVRELIDTGSITAGLETLQQLLEENGDFLVPVPGKSELQSFHSILEQLFINQNTEYERLFGPGARQQLTEARTNENIYQLENVVRRYEFTAAGAVALRELASLYQDQGSLGLSARYLERLARHPQTKDPLPVFQSAYKLLLANGDTTGADLFLKRHPEAAFPNEADKNAFLAKIADNQKQATTEIPIYEWRMPFGNPQHLGKTALAPAFAAPQWTAELVHDTFDFWLVDAPEVGQKLGDDTRSLMNALNQRIRSQSNNISMPAPSPLVVNDLVVTPGPGSVKAYNLQSGELVWNGLIIDETFEYLSKWSYAPSETQDNAREDMRNLFAAVRGWRDLTSSSLSTDGQRVYAVTDCQLVGTTSPSRMMMNTQRHPLLPQRSNRLIAYDLASEGKIVWPLGQQNTSVNAAFPKETEVREIFFLGAPLPVQERLYVLGEERGQIQLFELDPATGTILWTIGLLNPDRDLVIDEARRLSGLTPAYSNGILICPTGEGTLSAVDPIKRQLLWTHFYSSPLTLQQAQMTMSRAVRPQNIAVNQARDELLADQRWFDSRVMITDEYVIFTPPDDNKLVILNLHNGERVHPKVIPRGQSLYAATMYHDHLVLVGRNEIATLNVSGGDALWKRPIPIPAPSGRGLRMGDQFLQPIRTGEIAVIDLPSGRLLTRIPVGSGQVPGNLVAAKGQLLIQGATGLEVYRSLNSIEQEIAGRLKEDEKDSLALAYRGTLELQSGKLDAGLESLKNSADSKNAVTLAQSVLVWSVLDGLRTDFATYRTEAKKIQPRLQGVDQQLQFLKTFARGLQNANESQEAFSDYQRILQLLPWPETLAEQDDGWSITDSRWTLSRMNEILTQSSPEMQAEFRQRLQEQFQTISPDLFLRLTASVPAHWLNETLVLERLAKIPSTVETANQREETLRPMLESKEPQIRATAAALLLQHAKNIEDLQVVRETLAILESASVPLIGFEETNSTQLAKSIREEEPVKSLFGKALEWKQPIAAGENQGSAGRMALQQIPRLGPASAALDGWTFFMDQAGAHVEIFDPQGRHRERIATGYPGLRYSVESDLSRYVTFFNHTAMVVLLDRFMLIDFQNDTSHPRLVANRTLFGDNESGVAGRSPFAGATRTGLRAPLVELLPGQYSGNAGPICRSILCYSSGNSLVAISPSTGLELWRRRDITPGSEVLADSEFIVVKAPDKIDLKVYRALDGEFVRDSKLPLGVLVSHNRQGADWGRFLPSVTTSEEGLTWSLFDPATAKTVWTKTFPANARWSIVDNQNVAFVKDGHQLSVLNGLTGEQILAASIPTKTSIEKFTLLRFPEHWLLTTSTQRTGILQQPPYGIRSSDQIQTEVNGIVSSLNPEDGSVIWSKEISGQNLLTQAPREWPVLLFARGRGRMESLILNRLTGDEIRRSFAPDDGSGVSWLTETKPLRLNLKFAQDRVTLYFGEEPPPSRKPTLAPPQAEPTLK
ncbi:outer membrane protein assembly factor BamB family protein [Planctomicrobium sp. SH527]|uniref:outer membrane protein assembly factor BamB family protein n=1 Tax=Planctomicrobium sp. SH527 TaxID=3448123 RepID=UPI003F5C22AC